MRRRSGIKIVMGLIGLVKSMIFVMFAAVILGVLGFLASISISVLGAQAVVDILSSNTERLTLLFAILIVCGVVRGFLRYGEQASNHYIAFKLLAIIRDRVFRKLRELAPAKLETKEKGNLVSMITSDVELLEVFYAHTISPVLIAIIVSIIMIIYITSFHPLLGGLAAIAYIVVGVILPVYTSKVGKDDGLEQREQFGSLNSYVLECVNGMKEIMQFQRSNERIEELIDKSTEYNKVSKKLKKAEGTSKALTDFVIMFFTLSMFALSAWLYTKGELTFGVVLIATVAMASSFGPVTALSNLANNLVVTFASGERVLSLLEEEPQIKEVKDGVNKAYEGAAVDNVTFAYDDEAVLKDVSLSISKNKIIGIKGKSGSGKSTLLKLLMRFFDSQQGTVSISGSDIREWSTSGIRKIESYVTQETYLFNDTILNNIKVAKPEASDDEVIEACKKANIHEFITTLEEGYETNVGNLGSRLSGGQKQRMGIARAFLHDTDLLLLDEPTSNLDSLNEAIIMKAVKEHTKDKTVLLVSHRASSLKIADEVIDVKAVKAS
ncbi:amino acid ABC transporter ATP-binding/permease protein [Breznakia pachnodae]|uniref:ATP-binding cassette subfamily C protein n=1 Tax=Breznakia pachnodae TaxID=265178 RepID=A0ABU0E5T8_9FIRM|nr:ABC transporter ATP-binding protein [Breznakia pachnodae]MDQ0362242.1 ATP-binding cassette subfamily C protein [Breznakia pachnodae]